MWALTVLVLLWKCGNATCLPPPLARIMQASEQALVNEGLQEGREERVCFGVAGRACWCRVPAAAAAQLDALQSELNDVDDNYDDDDL